MNEKETAMPRLATASPPAEDEPVDSSNGDADEVPGLDPAGPDDPDVKPVKKAAAKKAAAPKKETGGKRVGSLLAQAKPLVDADEFVSVLYTGPQGSGKTTAAARMANLGPVIYINAEGGAKRRALAKMGVDVNNIRVLPEDPEELSYDYLETLFWEIKAALEDDPKAIAGVVWDSITEIHIKVLGKIRDYQNAKALRRGESRMKNTEAGDLLDRFFTDLSDYGVMTEQMRLLLRRYRDLPCHFAVTALIKRDKDSDGKVIYRPNVTPALGGDLVGYVDMVAVTSVADYRGNEEYRGLFRPVGLYEGKDRYSVTPRYLIDPTFDRLVDYVNEKVDVSTDPVMVAAKALRDANSDAEAAAAAEAEGDVDDAADDSE